MSLERAWESPEATPLFRTKSTVEKGAPMQSPLFWALLLTYPHSSHRVSSLWTPSHRSGRLASCRGSQYVEVNPGDTLPPPQPPCCTSYPYRSPVSLSRSFCANLKNLSNFAKPFRDDFPTFVQSKSVYTSVLKWSNSESWGTLLWFYCVRWKLTGTMFAILT